MRRETNELMEAQRTARVRRAALFTLVLLSTIAATGLMVQVVHVTGASTIKIISTVLFAVNFAWLAMAFWTAMAGVALRMLGRDPITLAPQGTNAKDLDAHPIKTRTAIVMPVYNEDPERVFARIEAVYRSVDATGQLARFDFFVLSDTQAPAHAALEEEAWRRTVHRLSADGRLFYRRREKNVSRKAGNISDFCRQWGRAYEHMVVLDADSLMAGELIVKLVRLMERNPTAGMIQTLPVAVNRETLFARFVQFAVRLNGPVLGAGLAFWQLGDGNYWGHNAIIRIAPFMKLCGLPTLPGRAPLGGEILSHDFVEAALMLRGGYSVWLLPESGGSYEEVPSNAIDYAKRDRRWCQGNLQHTKLVNARGMPALSRLHLLMGVFAYVSPLLWCTLLVLSTFEITEQALVGYEYFTADRSLFPVWPVAMDFERLTLFGVSIAILLVPKLLCSFLVLTDPTERRAFGGTRAIVFSTVVEVVFAMLLAPVMMLFHSHFVLTTLFGRGVSWETQERSDRGLSFSEAFDRHWVHTAIGLTLAIGLAFVAPRYLAWLAPVFVGMILSIPVSMLGSRLDWGLRLRRWGIFVTPEERSPPPVVAAMAAALEAQAEEVRTLQPLPAAPKVRVPPVRPGEMVPQPIDQELLPQPAWQPARDSGAS